MRFRPLIAVSILAALSLAAANTRAGDGCLDPECAMVALFDTGAAAGAATKETPSTAATRYGEWGIDLTGMDPSVEPGDDFFGYVNGKWAATTEIPADKSSFGAFQILRDLSDDRVRAILDGWAANKDMKPGSDEAKVAELYRSYLDEATIEKLDSKPIEPLLDAVKKAATRDDIARLMGRSRATFGASLFSPSVSDDAKDPDNYTLYLSQAGLGLRDRDYYLRDNFKAQKERYEQYVADMLRLVGWDEPEKNAAEVVALETKIAEAHWSRAESRNRDKTYNPTTVAALVETAPGFPWALWFESAELDKADRVVVRQNTALPKMAQVFGETSVATLQAWTAFHVVDSAAPLLSKRFVDTEWEFRSKFLSGAQEQEPRWKRAIAATERAMGEAIGRTYVAEYFPPESKAKMEALVANLRAALGARIENLSWMTPETRKRALEKLARFGVKIGYTSSWRDYSRLEVVEGDVAGNAERAARFEWNRQVDRIGNPVDKAEWGMTPQTVNAYYASTRNEIVFPAAILQPPFFDPEAEMAVNYGAIGGVIGHEITHGFDDQGRKSDGEGVLRDWWTPEDAKKFEEQAARLGNQYEAFEFPQLPDLHINPGLTMGENIADLGGILLGLDAYHASLGGEPAPELDGFTGDQRVFMGWAQVWRTLMRDDALREQLVTNSHSPGMVRAFAPLRNVDAWYLAFDVKEGEKNYLKPEERVRIW